MSHASLLKLLDMPAPDMPVAHIDGLRKAVEKGAASTLSAEREQGPFMLYLLGNDYQSIAEQSGWPLNVILFTALKNNWFEKKQMLDLDNQKEAARYVIKQAVNSMLATTTAVIMKQMQQIMKGEIDPADCKYIPKDIYAMEKFLSVAQQLHKLTEKSESSSVQNINVNVANLPAGGANVKAVAGDATKELPMPSLTLEEYSSMSREDRLKILAKEVKK
jgi:hypothetical protein